MSPEERLTRARVRLKEARLEYELASAACGNDPRAPDIFRHLLGYLFENPILWGDNDAAIFDGGVLMKGPELWFKMSGFQEFLSHHNLTFPARRLSSILQEHGIQTRPNTTVAHRSIRPWVLPMAIL